MAALRNVAALALALSLATFGGGCAADAGDLQTPPSSTADQSSLVGGQIATDEMFRSTILLRGGCTAAKVGPRQILTAAHCVHDTSANTVRSSYTSGSSITFTKKRVVEYAGEDDQLGFRTATIESTAIHPAWLEATPHAVSGVVVLAPEIPPDVAIITLTANTARTLADVPAGKIDSNPIRVGEKVSVLGYGCEAGLYADDETTARTLRYAVVGALRQSAIVHEGSFFGQDDPRLPLIAKSYAITPGQGRSRSGASLCPGDSGGSLYRGDGSSNLIVGVNAYYTFDMAKNTDGVAVTNMHTRLDRAARNGVMAWLEDQGATIAE